MSESDKIQDWFSLKYKNYKLTPKVTPEHRKFFAKRSIQDTDIKKHLEMFDLDLTSDEAPKRLYFGDPGAGKSHLILHILDYLESKGFTGCYLDCPPLRERDMPIRLFTEFLSKIGMRTILDILGKAYDSVMQQASKEISDFYKNPRLKADEHLMKEFGSADLVEVIANYISEESKHIKIQKWLQGEKIKELAVQNLTDNVTTLTEVWVTILKLISKEKNKKIVLIFDELHNMQEVSSKLAPQHSRVFVGLVDDIQTYAAVILCFSGSTVATNEIINDHVRRRITNPNQIQVGTIKSPELEDFCGELIRFNRAEDDAFIAEQCQKYQNETMGETLVPELYPFTKESIEKLKTAMARAKPGDINGALTWACADAQSQGRHVVLADDISTVVRQRTIGQN